MSLKKLLKEGPLFLDGGLGSLLQARGLKPGEAPHAEFITEEAPVAVYEYCNLHGLWKADA